MAKSPDERTDQHHSQLSPFQRIYFWVENVILTNLVPQLHPGPVFKWLFKVPVVIYTLGLGNLIGKQILILTTTGRKTGKQRKTPLEYGYEEETGAYLVMAGWGGKTDWYRNALADPRVHIQVGDKRIEAAVEVMTDEEVTELMAAVTRTNPGAVGIWSRASGEPVTASVESLSRAAKHFPSLRLRPVD